MYIFLTVLFTRFYLGKFDIIFFKFSLKYIFSDPDHTVSEEVIAVYCIVFLLISKCWIHLAQKWNKRSSQFLNSLFLSQLNLLIISLPLSRSTQMKHILTIIDYYTNNVVCSYQIASYSTFRQSCQFFPYQADTENNALFCWQIMA